MTRAAREISRRAALLTPVVCAVAMLLALPLSCAASGPVPPCAGTPLPAYTNPGDQPAVQVYHDTDLGRDWRPAACARWPSPYAKPIVALAARFASTDDVDTLLARFGAISTLLDVRYWSVTDRQWQRLFREAVALREANLSAPRPDFTSDELKSGADLYFAETDNRSSAAVVYRLNVRDLTPRSFVIESENVTPIRFFFAGLSARQLPNGRLP